MDVEKGKIKRELSKIKRELISKKLTSIQEMRDLGGSPENIMSMDIREESLTVQQKTKDQVTIITYFAKTKRRERVQLEEKLKNISLLGF